MNLNNILYGNDYVRDEYCRFILTGADIAGLGVFLSGNHLRWGLLKSLTRLIF
jgi:hypothetical protein